MKPSVLLAEDDSAVRVVLVRRLRHLGYDVIACADGEGAVAVASDHAIQIDVVLTDMVMPGINGAETARRITEIRGPVPVIFMSGYLQDDAMSTACAGPNRHFIEKPFQSDELVTKLAAALAAEPATV